MRDRNQLVLLYDGEMLWRDPLDVSYSAWHSHLTFCSSQLQSFGAAGGQIPNCFLTLLIRTLNHQCLFNRRTCWTKSNMLHEGSVPPYIILFHVFVKTCHFAVLIFTRTWLRYVRVFAIAIPSVVCLSVCNVGAPYSGGLPFRQIFFTAVYAGHPLTSVQNFTELVLGEPLRRER